MSRRRLTLRWSWRDLRQRWVLVITIAVILAIGTGTFAALGSTATWRRASNDASFAATNLHDLRVTLSTGNLVDEGSLEAVVRSIPDTASITATDERLVWPTQLDIPDPEEGDTLARGQLVGSPVDGTVDTTWLETGRELTPDEAGSGRVLIERQFAKAHHLADEGTMELAGGRQVRWVGHVLQPEHFMGGTPDEEATTSIAMLDPGVYGVLFTSLPSAQQLAGEPGQVNDLVLTLAAGTDVAEVQRQIKEAFARDLPAVGAEVTTRDDVPSYRVLYEDIDNDQQVWNLISLLVLLGASFAAFNLINRIVEAQRREIGIGMALGVPRRELAIRPLLVGVQIALLGVMAGVLVGGLLNQALKGIFEAVLPLPVWRTDFQPGTYARAVAIGLALPFLATVLPVWRAVRVEPIEAIRTGHFATGRSGWAGLGAGLRWPRRSTRQYPLRNLLRHPRRSLLTALAVGASITVLVGIVGMLDSFTRMIDDADTEITYRGADRLDVLLSTFVPEDSATVRTVEESPTVARVVPGLSLPGRLVPADEEDAFDVSLEVLSFDDAPWAPRVTGGERPSPEAGVLLSEKAAGDLGVHTGDTVVLEHPRRDGMSYRIVRTTLRVAGTHGIPVRSYVFLDRSQAELFDLAGITNTLQVEPAPGVTTPEAQRALFGVPGLAAAMPIADLGETFQDALGQFTGILRVMELAVLLLALLIAFNATSVSVDERAREHATMFAFGLPVRTVLGMTITEAVAIGVLGTLIGVGAGWLVLQWMFSELLPQTLPEIGVSAYLSTTTIVAALVAGVVAVAVAPLFTIRKLRHMDVPATLRVVE